MKKTFLVMAFAFFGLISCGQRVRNLDVEGFAVAVEQGARIVDVRTPDEYAEGCIPGAVNVDWNAEKFVERIDAAFDDGEPLYLYCRSGRRSAAAARELSKAGYKVHNLLGGYVAWTEAGRHIDQDPKYAATLLAPGTEAPDFVLGDLDGREVRLGDFRGRDVVLVFWASWCPDCRAEVPELKAMYADADPRRVQFVSVSFDREFEALRTFVADNDLPGVQLFDPAGKKDSAVGAAYGVKWIPSLYLIGADGRVRLGTVMAWKIAEALKEGRLAASGAGAAPARATASPRPCDDPDHCTLGTSK